MATADQPYGEVRQGSRKFRYAGLKMATNSSSFLLLRDSLISSTPVTGGYRGSVLPGLASADLERTEPNDHTVRAPRQMWRPHGGEPARSGQQP